MLRRIFRTVPAVIIGALNAWIWMIFLLPTSMARFSGQHLADAALLSSYFLLATWVVVVLPCSILLPESSPIYRFRWSILAGAGLAVVAFLICGALFDLFDPMTEWRFMLRALPAVVSTGAVIGGVLSWIVSRSYEYVIVEEDDEADQSPVA